MKKLLIAVATACAALLVSFKLLAAGGAINPYVTANDVAAKTLSELQANNDRLGDRDFVNDLINRLLMPHVDVKYAAYKIIGTSLKQTSEQERNEFTAAFNDYLVESMSGALGKYSGQELVPANVSEPDPSAKMVAVKMAIKDPGKADIVIVLKMRKNTRTGEWKVYDLVAENISILDAKQSELSPVIKSKGIKEAIRMLKENKTLPQEQKK